jgi:preprotein translocase subunit YajC
VWPYLITFALLIALMLYSAQRRRRQAASEMVQLAQISFGDEVMTTSGLYGTVVGRNDDGTVQLAIAPGVVVKWALAALRTPDMLADRYREPIAPEAGPEDPEGPSDGP